MDYIDYYCRKGYEEVLATMQMKHKDVVNVFDATVEAIREVLVHEHLKHYLNTVTCNNVLQLNMISQ